MSHLGGKFEFTPFKVALRETIQWLLEHYDTDARIGRRGHSDKGAYKGAANGGKISCRARRPRLVVRRLCQRVIGRKPSLANNNRQPASYCIYRFVNGTLIQGSKTRSTINRLATGLLDLYKFTPPFHRHYHSTSHRTYPTPSLSFPY